MELLRNGDRCGRYGGGQPAEPVSDEDGVQVYVIGGDLVIASGEPHEHGTALQSDDHCLTAQVPVQYCGTSCEWEVTNHLELKEVLEYEAHVRGASASGAVDDSEVKVRYSLFGVTRDWYTAETWAREPHAGYLGCSRAMLVTYENMRGYEKYYGFNLYSQLLGQDMACHVHESFKDWNNLWPGGENQWVLPEPGYFGVVSDWIDAHVTLVEIGPPPSVGPNDPGAGTPVRVSAHKWWGGSSTPGLEEGVSMLTGTHVECCGNCDDSY